MIQFQAVRYKNLLSTGNMFTEIQLDRSPNTLVIGENGAGKSTMLDALTLGLFGRPFRNVSKPQLVSSINEKDCVVEVDFKIGSVQWKVVRGIKPAKFEIWKNDKQQMQLANARDFQTTFEKTILKLNYKSFTQIVVLGNSSFIPFMQLKTAHRREVIEDLLDIEIFSMMNQLLKEMTVTNRDELKELQYQFELSEDKHGVQEKYIEAIKESSQKQINAVDREIDDLNTDIANRQDEITTLEIRGADLAASIKDGDKVERKNDKYQSLDSDINQKLIRLTREIKFYEENDNCPTCHQDISEDFRSHEMGKKEEKIVDVSAGAVQLRAELERMDARLIEISLVRSQPLHHI